LLAKSRSAGREEEDVRAGAGGRTVMGSARGPEGGKGYTGAGVTGRWGWENSGMAERDREGRHGHMEKEKADRDILLSFYILAGQT
jgi:hypothetical protein